MIRKIPSLVVSENVINLLLNHQESEKINALIESYQNGREHGHLIWAIKSKPDVAYYICQYRKSDEICIYKGKYQLQSISEDAYSNPKFFPSGEYEKAIDWLINDILS